MAMYRCIGDMRNKISVFPSEYKDEFANASEDLSRVVETVETMKAIQSTRQLS